MTQANSPSAYPSTPAADMGASPGSADILLNLVVIFLAPVFLSAANGDIALARLAAAETVNSYRANSQADLLAVAQIVAFGFATLGSLCLSMADDISLTMVLRLRGNANALSRSAEAHRRRLEKSRADINQPPTRAHPPAQAHQPQADQIRSDAPTQPPVATPAAQPRQTQPVAAAAPAITPAPVSTPSPVSATDPASTLWAAACVEAAEQLTTELSHLSPSERQLAVLQASVLSSCATDFLAEATEEQPAPSQR